MLVEKKKKPYKKCESSLKAKLQVQFTVTASVEMDIWYLKALYCGLFNCKKNRDIYIMHAFEGVNIVGWFETPADRLCLHMH